MRAALIREYGSNDVVELAEVDRPLPQADEVVVRVHAAGVNPIDWKIRNGAGQRLGMTLPIRLGGELVGTIEALGSGVDGFKQGEAVFGMVHTGAFADYAVAKAVDLVRKPANLDFVQAAALPLAGSTAWQALFDEAGLSAGQRLLITNSSGGVGSLAVQLGKPLGAGRVIATASNEDKRELALSLGADPAVDVNADDLAGALIEANGGERVDAVFEMAGGRVFE